MQKDLAPSGIEPRSSKSKSVMLSTILCFCKIPFLDLKEAPFNMTGAGIGDHLRIAEIGGLGNLYPEIEKEKFYDLKVKNHHSPLLYANFSKSVQNVSYQRHSFSVPELDPGMWLAKILNV